MSQITASEVKALREQTGAGMMDCKKALQESDGDMEAAVDWLRTKGLAAAQKKAGRIASEGLVAVRVEGAAGSLVEVNSETDFVARNDKFQAFVNAVSELAAAANGDIDALKLADYPGAGQSVEAELTSLIATIGENLTLRRTATLSVEKGVVGAYVHSATAPGLGRIGVIVGLESAGDAAALEPLAKQIAMHIAATAPAAVSVDSLDPALVTRERNVLTEQARESGRPENIIEKMVEGRLSKFFQEAVLLEQTWVHDGESKVAKIVEEAGSTAGAPIQVAGFVRFALGEGIDKEAQD
ncbi:MAG: translation elongation factor Ts [Alphaproteobacteria bacterium]|jgi:elongation factor Ts|nr:translation elongation factor Ts [Alphaproteobacteria bacterium]